MIRDFICWFILFITIFGLIAFFVFTGFSIGQYELTQKLCNQTEYDFCIPEPKKYKLKD